MKFRFQHLLLLLAFGFFMTACNDDENMGGNTGGGMEEPEKEKYEEGVLVINEGPFGSGTGTLDFWERSVDTLLRNVYQAENNDMPIGNILQYAGIIGDDIYLVANNAQKIEVADANTLVYERTITELNQPRSILDLGNDEILVAEWGADGLSGRLAKINSTTGEIISRIESNGPERMLKKDDLIYVLNNGGFADANTVTFLNADLTEDGARTVGQKPNSIVEDMNGDVWVLSGGSYTTFDGASLVQFDGKMKAWEMPLGFGASKLCTNGDKDELYFLVGKTVQRLKVGEMQPTVVYTFPEMENGYALGVDPVSNQILLATTDYATDSKLYFISEEGELLNTMTSGLLTNGFIFR